MSETLAYRKQGDMRFDFTACFEKVPEGYIGYLAELPGANTQAPTLEDARHSLAEAALLVLRANRDRVVGQASQRNLIHESFTVDV